MAVVVNPTPVAPTGSASQSFCSSSSPSVASLTATGSNIQWYGNSSGGTALISTTPLVNGSHYYASQTNVSGCESSARLDVTANVYTTLTGISYGVNPAVYCTGTAITNSPVVTGGTAASYSVSPALPAGLSLNTNTGVISGTPTVASSASDYVITATNSCGITQTTLNITVLAGVSGLNYTTTPVTYCTNIAITPNTVSAITGGGTNNLFRKPGITGRVKHR